MDLEEFLSFAGADINSLNKANNIFTMLDLDRDNKISKEEFTSYLLTLDMLDNEADDDFSVDGKISSGVHNAMGEAAQDSSQRSFWNQQMIGWYNTLVSGGHISGNALNLDGTYVSGSGSVDETGSTVETGSASEIASTTVSGTTQSRFDYALLHIDSTIHGYYNDHFTTAQQSKIFDIFSQYAPEDQTTAKLENIIGNMNGIYQETVTGNGGFNATNTDYADVVFDISAAALKKLGELTPAKRHDIASTFNSYLEANRTPAKLEELINKMVPD